MTKLAGDRSERWAFMERFDVPNYDDDGVYLTRWRVVQTPLFGVYVHRFQGPDPRNTLHDHPYGFLSIVLRGGYTERRLNPLTMVVDEAHHVRWINRIRTHDAHAITSIRHPTWTLVFAGRRRRTWGYLEPDPTGVQWEWTEFDKHPHAAVFAAAMARMKAKEMK